MLPFPEEVPKNQKNKDFRVLAKATGSLTFLSLFLSSLTPAPCRMPEKFLHMIRCSPMLEEKEGEEKPIQRRGFYLTPMPLGCRYPRFNPAFLKPEPQTAAAARHDSFQVQCWSPDHAALAAISITGLAIWWVGLPLALYARILTLRDRQNPSLMILHSRAGAALLVLGLGCEEGRHRRDAGVGVHLHCR